MLPKRLSRLPMCQPMEARLTHPQLPIQLVSFCFIFYFGSLVFGFLFVLPLISLLFFPFWLFEFLFSGFGWLTFVVFKKRQRWDLVFGVVLGGTSPFLFCFHWENDVIRPCN